MLWSENPKEDITMKNRKRIIALLLCVLIIACMLCSCVKTDSGTDTITTSANTGATETVSSDIQSVLDSTVETPDITNATTIKLSDETTASSGGSVKAENNVTTITTGGTYVFSGTVSEGRIIVNAPKEEVTIVLDGADITCSYGSPIYVYKSSLTTIYLAEGSENTLTDGSTYTFDDEYSSSEDEEPNACLYSKSDLIIAGSGKLTVNANNNNGITSKDTLKIEDACITVTAKNHGINGKDYCVIKNADIKVTSGGDALRSTNDSDTTLGYVAIENSTLDLTSGEDGIQAETSLSISGGKCTITSGGGAAGKVSSDISAKGIKAGASITLLSGEYELDCCDDAIHSNGNVSISGGTYSIKTGDDGVHADENVNITGGEITISKSYEGIEGATIDISGGTISIVASDDGMNAAGGNDQSGFAGRPDTFGSSSNYYINISGGKITIDASGDGIDSNGSLTVSGGEIYVNGPTSNGDGALDYDGTASITGGIIVAVGSSGMAQNFGNGSTQGSILLNYSSSSKSDVVLKDSSGNVLVSYTPSKSYNSVVISCPSLVKGGTYTITACGQTTEVTLTSLIYGSSSGMGGGGNPGGGGGGGFPGGHGGRPF